MKLEWRKTEKELYLPPEKPVRVTVPALSFFAIEGTGDPNKPEFQEKISVLYALSYAVRMMPKSGYTPDGYAEYTVYPLEGVWDLVDYEKGFSKTDKDNFKYTVMIRQPAFVTEEIAVRAFEIAKKKKTPMLEQAKFVTLKEGDCVQMMHIGAYDDEPASFALMEKFCLGNGLARSKKTHREIYIGDPRKSQPEKLQTVLRFEVEKA